MEWMCKANNFLNYYLNQPLNKQNIKPKEVWFGCGGASIWNVILIEKLRRIGCTVVTHDHGSGNAHMDQKTHHWIDFLHSDRFITFNETLVKIKKNNVNKDLLFQKPIPKIEFIGEVDNKVKANEQKQIKKICQIKKSCTLERHFMGKIQK